MYLQCSNRITKDSAIRERCGIREADLVKIYARYMCNAIFSPTVIQRIIRFVPRDHIFSTLS